jgi:hypothetical protein
MFGPWSRENECAFSDQIEKGVNRLCIAAKIPADLAKHDFCRMQRTAACGKNSYAPLVPLIGLIEPANQRSGINDGFYFHTLPGWKDHAGL